MRIGTKIRRIRRFQNMTLQEIADQIHLSTGTISLIERNSRFPTENEIMDIAVALHVPMEDIISLEEFKELRNGKLILKGDLGSFSDEELIQELDWRKRMKELGVSMKNQIERRRKADAKR